MQKRDGPLPYSKTASRTSVAPCSTLGAHLCLLASLLLCFQVQAEQGNQAAGGEESLEEISRKLENPLSDMWGLTFQENYSRIKGDGISGHRYANTAFFQPFMPLPLGEDKIFTLRPVIPIVKSPVFDPDSSNGTNGHKSGLGDIQMVTLVGPDRSDGLVWGAGATFKFPTAEFDEIGQGKYQAGPALMLFSLTKPWTIGIFAQHWESYAGDDDRKDTSQTDIQYVIRRSFPGAWSLGMGPTISIDWEADSDNRLTLPVGLGLTKTVRIWGTPVKMRIEPQYSIISPDDYGTDWNVRFQFTPVLKNPYRKR